LFQLEGNRTAVLPGGWSPREGNVKDRVFGIGVDQHVSVDRAVSSAVSIAFTDSLLQNQFQRSDLMDNCHFNVPGNEKMARLVHRFPAANHFVN
jgi:hypothetical protein